MPGNAPRRYSRKASPPADVPAHWQQARVLVVDDHATYRLLVGSLLQMLGVAHEACGDGRMALHALETGHFDLVITDCRMPVMDGFAMTREWRRREYGKSRPGIPIIAMTGRLGPEEIRRCLESGMDGWLVKPINLGQLHELLTQWLAPAPLLCARGRQPQSPRRRRERFPSRDSLIATFGSWSVVEAMLTSLLREARDDLEVLVQARISGDATLTSQRLHRLAGSVAFLGATVLERRAAVLIDRVQANGVGRNRQALERFHRDVECYLQRLHQL
ncbi:MULTISPECIES: Hpt domain-containing response regulator [unclassified Pseudomonas]|jgi:CheY-like chemotaxis protein/HPt (histidine-containing phosphotransfer) domain-containing protein|uniref:Hpt domain-containing response regulator n=1 Tax=unclassified Pseudomonas TaxID=196821 RepID=UPI0008B7CDD0|nr:MULTISPECIES: response regulator [unclassified Pseudomonas]SES77792.1 CheY chemotaxis protein or a CheY-like REC (receiver) domain [Pseudomonas sp. NFR09]SFB11721.1 CheY chemotaxis protein or a CheY-like REC (receiver) domain [Pseudomonas sp. NFPP24]SFH79742.1 CheY chemotaxis protein or a CheY-like REC (receiver) domain [Pseudomonas sp. NFPP04]SFI27876.1 CheY chemotaxis protein or a CheY-like REC (receiver) domain [Pseudomonas sp. NFPP11]SFO83707.1 CheY chemotaxis protein or a CheY-like REC